MNVFDASAVLAVLFGEPGSVRAAQLMVDGDAQISSVNMAEVVARVIERGASPAQADAACGSLDLEVVSFTHQQAITSGRLRASTRSFGLSLGDRCCLALAADRPDARVVTADRPWKAIKGFRFEFIR